LPWACSGQLANHGLPWACSGQLANHRVLLSRSEIVGINRP